MRELLRRAEVEPGPGPDRDDALDVCVVTETFPPEINGVTLTLGREGLGHHAHVQRVVSIRPQFHLHLGTS